MSLLREIQDSAIDSSVSLSVLLRKCKVLAARLGNQDFKKWIEYELNGYRDCECSKLPEYRIYQVNSKGHFAGAFGSGLKNADIPIMCIPETLQEAFSHTYISQSVASIESTANQAIDNKSSTLKEPWPADATALVGQDIYTNMNCMQAWKVIPVSLLIETLDAIRNRILNFVLEIESEAPDAGEAQINSAPLPQEKVNQIFNTYITGNVQNVATGNADVNQNATMNGGNDELFIKLVDELRSINANHIPIEDVILTVNEMKKSQGTGGFKEKYNNFMSIVSDHITVLGPVIAPYLVPLSQMLP